MQYEDLFRVMIGTPAGDCLRYEGVDACEQILQLIDGKTLLIAMDQSTSHTGVAVLDSTTDDLVLVLDLINLGFPKPIFYEHCLQRFMQNNFGEANVSQLVYEAPLLHANQAHTRMVLTKLAGIIAMFPAVIPSLSPENVFALDNTTWKSHFLASPVYANRRKKTADVKYAAMEESVHLFPSLVEYTRLFPTPPDCCDAIGIAYGFLKESRSTFSKNIRRPNKSMTPSRKTFQYGVKSISLKEFPAWLKREYPQLIEKNMVEVLEFNPAFTIQQNCQRYRGVSDKTAFMLITDDKAASLVKWELHFEKKDNELYCIILL